MQLLTKKLHPQRASTKHNSPIIINIFYFKIYLLSIKLSRYKFLFLHKKRPET